MNLSNKMYDQLKFVAMILLPAVGTLYASVAAATGLPAAEQVVAVIIAIDAFLGVLLGISGSKPESFDGYLGSDGSDPDTGYPNLRMTITKPPQELVSGKAVRLKVGHPPAG